MVDELEKLRNINEFCDILSNRGLYREAPPEDLQRVSEELDEYIPWGKLEYRLPHLTKLTRERVKAIGRNQPEDKRGGRPAEKKKSRKLGKFHKEGTEKQKAWGRSEACKEVLRKAREKIKPGTRGRRNGLVNGARGITGRKLLKMATDKAKEVAEKAFHNMDRAQTAQAADGFVKEGVVDKNILGNMLLMEAAVVALARWPDTHPEDTLKGQYVYGLAARMDALKTIMPYCISKPEQATVIRAESVEDYILRMADEDAQDVEAISHEP